MMHVPSCCLIYLTYSFFDVLVAVADAFEDSYPLMSTQMIRNGVLCMCIYFIVKLILPHMAP